MSETGADAHSAAARLSPGGGPPMIRRRWRRSGPAAAALTTAALAVAVAACGGSTPAPKARFVPPPTIPVEVASCEADARGILLALAAFHAHNGVYPTVPSPWSAANYVSNFSPLTTPNSSGHPYYLAAPPTTNYVIEYDGSGHVWVEAPGVYDSSYKASRAFEGKGEACDVATR